MKNIDLIKIAAWIVLMLNLAVFNFFIPSFLKDYNEYQDLVIRMDSTQNRLIKELVDANNKTVDNQNQLMKYLKDEKGK